MEVKGEYGMASSTVGGGLYARPPALALCHSPLLYPTMARILVVTGGVVTESCFGAGEVELSVQRGLWTRYGGRRRRIA